MISKLYIQQLEACGKTIVRFQKRISLFSEAICKQGGNGYAFADDLSFLLNADPLTQLDDMWSRIEKLEKLTGIDFPSH